ncbi:MAG: M24 family metallopeptidase [Bacteriovoracaceae bacterium]|nr:M24 family metallopeptidase [Bacteriovoracaceae bacterium]
MKKNLTLSPQTIKQNIAKLQKFMSEQNLDGFYVSTFDVYLNEYVPLEDCHRYYFSGFTGSTSELLVPVSGKARLYVDGRYHEQADLEVSTDVVQVVKCDASTGITQALFEDVKSLNMKKVGLEADRASLGFLKRLEKVAQSECYTKNELASIVEFATLPAPKEIQFVERSHRGRDTLEKTSAIFENEKQGMYLAALDQIAWITNCRGYQLPNLSSFRAKALATKQKVYVFVTPETPISAQALKADGVEWIKVATTEISKELARLQNTLHLEEVMFDTGMLNCADFNMLLSVMHPERLKEKPTGLIPWMSIKEPAEIREMEASFKRSDKAIFNTIKWLKTSIKEGKRLTELDLWKQTEVKYVEQGSKELSFGTIAGVGPNGSIIHYGNPSDEVVIKADDMILLDSGGYFEGGFATDTTRTFFSSPTGKANPEYKKMYTLVLKGLLACLNSVFLEGTKGNVLDGICRAPLMKHGYNYAHGTGHGVGIHVHEDGVRLSLISQLPMKLGQVVSIEPGIYIPGFAGVRLENIAVVEKHPEFAGYLCFKSLTNVGFDYNLIDEALMNDEEKQQLAVYEAECAKRGNSLKSIV